MAWRPKNLNEASYPVTMLFAVIGHRIFQYPIGRERVLFSRVYAIITGSLYYFSMACYLRFLTTMEWSTTEEKLWTVIFFVNFGVAGMTQVIAWCKATMFSRIMKGLMNVDETLQELGANINYDGTMKFGISVIIYWLITFISLNCLSIFERFENYPLTVLIAFVDAVMYNYATHINSLVGLNFGLAVRTLELRFYKLNELVKSECDFLQPRDDYPRSFRQHGNISMNLTSRISSRRRLQAEENFKSLIQIVKHVHLELMVISERIDEIYGLPMALTIASWFISWTLSIYNIIKMVTDSSPHGTILAIVETLAWSIVTFINFMIINRSCERLSAEAKRTGNLIHGVDNWSKDSELSDEIKQFSLQLMQNHVCFSPAGIFNFGYPFVFVLIQSVVTYVVILKQSNI